MRRPRSGTALVALVVFVGTGTACASKDPGATAVGPSVGTVATSRRATSAPVPSRTCATKSDALTTIPQVPASRRLKETPTHYAPVRALDQLPPRTTKIARVLNRVLAGLDPSAQICADITAHGPGAGFPGPWMTATARVTSDRPAAKMYGEWQVDLLAGASAELFNVWGQASLNNVLVGLSPLTSTPGKAATATSEGRLGAVAAGQQFLSNTLSDPQIVTAVTKAVVRAGATPVSVQVWHPLGKAVSVTMRVRNLTAFRRQGWDTLKASILQSPAEFEGVYLAVDASDGTPLACFSSSGRFGAGGQWESQKAGFGYAHG